MKKHLVSALATASLMLAAGATRSWAGPIPFNNSSLNPDGGMVIGDTVTLGDETADVMARILPLTEMTNTCAPVTTSGCPTQNDGFTSQDASPMTTDFGTGFVPLTGGIAPLVLPDPTAPWVGNPVEPTTEAAVDFAMDINPPGLGGSGQNLLTEFTGPSDAVSEDVTPIFEAAVPESGSLILVGLGLVAGARYLRRPKVA